MQFNWNDIRSLNGSQANGFEELCAQLARAESPDGAKFVRKGTPDAGVECYCILPDGSEWGWQAKYFDTLGNSQWQQLDKSVKTALDNHPKLVRYFVCIPLDRPDARIEGQKSAMQRWNERVEKWERWAQKRDMCVEFVWWGSSELLERLSQNKHIGRRYFWFNQRGFDNEWFQTRLDEAVEVAGPRYTPEVHVDLPIARDLELFGRTESAFDAVKSLAREIRKELQYTNSSDSTQEDPSKIPALDDLLKAGNKILKTFSLLEYKPDGILSFPAIIKEIDSANCLASKAEKILFGLAREYDAKHQEENDYSPHRNNPFVQRTHRIDRLQSKLREVHSSLSHADEFINNNLMILNGKAGTGKTHLLCDFAKRRIASKAPTVLLMGQRFVTNDSPRTQMLQQLDLPNVSAAEFVGALEAAAQAADCRALLIIDALNEGQGRSIWPDNLAAFLSALEKSPWIGVLLSVRSTYEDVIIPEDIRKRAVTVIHEGFANHEYDATRMYCEHYGLELPSTPILQPEFQNPLLLKTLCRGLKDRGEQRLPRGFQGITSTLDLHLETINKKLAKELDFNPSDQLVRKALEKIATQLVKTEDRWLQRPEAEKIVNEVLPEREFSKSLYRGLINEGVLIEEIVTWKSKDFREEVVFISYDRFTDHIIANYFLKTYLDVKAPKATFSEGGIWAFIKSVFTTAYWNLRAAFSKRCGLAFICKEDVPIGLIEALCIQVPERTGVELVTLAPKLLSRWDIDEAFRQSVIWRKPESISKSTLNVLNELIKTQKDWDATLDVLLTITTLEDHPFNAEFLDKKLRGKSMPDRDAWWSTYLHRAWAKDDSGAVRRIVDWAWGVTEDTNLEEKTVDLCSIALAWMFTTSNRFLRDRATKALVSLLTGRLDAATRLVDRFSDVDDLYVVERIYAVTYGVAMRSHDAIGVGKLSSLVYEKVFANGNPPVHILLRDYARGDIERAIYLGSDLVDVDECLIRPPYKSTWPQIPDKEKIQSLMPDLSGDLDNRDWTKDRIAESVMDDDFARYVIGTNTHSTNWLSLHLDEDPWLSIEAQEEALRLKLSNSERLVWKKYKNAEIEFETSRRIRLIREESRQAEDQNTPSDGEDKIPITDPKTGKFIRWGYPIPRQNYELPENDLETEQVEQAFKSALKTLQSTLTPEHLAELEAISRAKSEDSETSVPLFDLSLIQRYVLWRVFDLGWTTERFGEFDQFIDGQSYEREASKAERIGKKYQWIAYHEILAYIADHYQYRDQSCQDKGGQAYEGPWQEYLRDIDPSCVLSSTAYSTSLGGQNPSWWGSWLYTAWDEQLSHWDWIKREDDMPDVCNLLSVKNSCDGTRWLNVDGYFNWRQSHPADVDPYDVERREIWFLCQGYFIQAKDTDAFMKWAKGVDFWNRWMPQSPEVYNMFLGEYGWSPAYGYSEWTTPAYDCPTSVLPALFKYNVEAQGFDCSIDESYTLRLPDHNIVKRLDLKWTREAANFIDKEERPAVFDPTAHEDGPSALLIREDLLKQYLSNEGLAFCWTIIGEKRVLGSKGQSERPSRLRISGAYKYTDQGPQGFLNPLPDKPRNENADSS